MFLTELYNFYQRKIAEPDSGLAQPGYGEANIGYVIRISPQGDYIHHMSLCDEKGKSRRMKVPASVNRSQQVLPNFLWDNTGYVLGIDGKGKPERSLQTFEAFRQKHIELAEKTGNSALQAIAAFLRQWTPETIENWSDKDDILDKNIIFEIEGQDRFIHEQPDIQALWQEIRHQQSVTGTEKEGFCLITGAKAPIARIHPQIMGLRGGNTSGTALISFNCDAFTSYGKDQSYNAPVSVQAAQAYTTALNWLMRFENGHSTNISDTTIVFWTDKPAPKEQKMVSFIFSPPTSSDSNNLLAEDSGLLGEMEGIFHAIRSGQTMEHAMPGFDSKVRFFILGIAPNNARISVRFWQTASFGELALRVGKYYSELSLDREYDTQPEFPAFWQILLETAVLGKKENIPPMLGGALMRSVFGGLPYPASLYTAVLGRIRADKKVNYLRTAIIKACLIRNYKKEFVMSHTDRKDVPYLLGCLFSLLEKNQQDAQGKSLNSTIRDRYIASASATPGRVFPLLLRLTQHHISKSEFENTKQRDIARVMNGISAFPSTLTLEEQGTFFLGYYHQNIANYTKKDKE